MASFFLLTHNLTTPQGKYVVGFSDYAFFGVPRILPVLMKNYPPPAARGHRKKEEREEEEREEGGAVYYQSTTDHKFA